MMVPSGVLLLVGVVGFILGVIFVRFPKRSRALGSELARSQVVEDRVSLGAILSSMTEGVVAVDSEQVVVHMNTAAENLFDLKAEQCIGAPAWKILRQTKIIEVLEATLQQDDEQKSEVEISTNPRDPRRMVELRGAPLREAEGRVAGAVLVFHDVTRLRHLESVRQDFVANVSHEIKTPLASIRGMVETMIDDPSMEASTQTEFLSRILRQTQRLGNLVNDLMALSRFERDDVPLAQDDLDLRQILLEANARFRSPAEAKELRLSVDLPLEDVLVRGDSEALRQVFDNLLSNATRYTPEGGEIAVTLKIAGNQAWAEVIDSGIGIDEQHLDRIFERFYRVDRARSRELGGTGLGLSIVKHITVRLGGGVTVQSKVGEGSSFRVYLPLLRQEAASEPDS